MGEKVCESCGEPNAPAARRCAACHEPFPTGLEIPEEPVAPSPLQQRQDRQKRIVGGVFALLLIAMGVFVCGRSVGTNTPEWRAEVACRAAIPKRMKSPSQTSVVSAGAACSAESCVVVGDVDAPNGFGVMLRSSYECVTNKAGSQTEVLRLTIE